MTADNVTVPLAPFVPNRALELWMQIDLLFQRHGLAPPPYRLRDELVTHLSWAHYGADLAAAPSVPSPVDQGWTGEQSDAFDRAFIPDTPQSFALIRFNEFVERKRYLDAKGYALRAEEWPEIVEIVRAGLSWREDQGSFAGAHTQPGAADGVVSDLLEALRLALPSNLSVNNPVVSDSVVVSLDATMGDLRKIAAAIAKATAHQADADPDGSQGPLWMMHVRGPDDIYPAPDYVTALAWCDYLNVRADETGTDVQCSAVPAIWCGTPASHAAGLADAIAGWTQPLPAALPPAEVKAETGR